MILSRMKLCIEGLEFEMRLSMSKLCHCVRKQTNWDLRPAKTQNNTHSEDGEFRLGGCIGCSACNWG